MIALAANIKVLLIFLLKINECKNKIKKYFFPVGIDKLTPNLPNLFELPSTYPTFLRFQAVDEGNSFKYK
jgi:hypothetical protein